jgi:hypothetical protein
MTAGNYIENLRNVSKLPCSGIWLLLSGVHIYVCTLLATCSPILHMEELCSLCISNNGNLDAWTHDNRKFHIMQMRGVVKQFPGFFWQQQFGAPWFRTAWTECYCTSFAEEAARQVAGRDKHHDNAPGNTSLVVQQFLSSPSHCTLWISLLVTFGCFLLWKWASRGNVLQSLGTSNRMRRPNSKIRKDFQIPKETFRRRFQQWQDRWNNCVRVCVQGSHFEGDQRRVTVCPIIRAQHHHSENFLTPHRMFPLINVVVFAKRRTVYWLIC